jgi:flagellar hook-associated protein 1 FlgK
MSIAAAFNTALSGLNVANRTAQVVSNNIANALTPGYARRQLDVSSAMLGGHGQGARVHGVSRAIDPALLAERRLADAALGQQAQHAQVLSSVAGIFGGTEAGGLSDRFAQFEHALIEAAARPDSETRLQSVATTARELAGALNAAGAAVQDDRAAADRAIGRDVALLNTGLERVRELNLRIAAASDSGDAQATLKDMRQVELDALAEIVPLRLFDRPDGQVAIASGGHVLLDGSAAEIGFTAANAVDAGATLGGLLSGLTVNGQPVAAPPGGGFEGGRLAANFRARDVDLPAAQAQLDAIARDLVVRLSGSDADPTLAAGAPGLFTDAGAAFSAADETGLAQRLALNALADPAAGGGTWRLRDGLGAAGPGPVGDPAAFNRLIDVLAEARAPASGDFGAGSYSMAGLFGEASARAGSALADAEYELAFATARSDALVQEEMAQGVDTDAELQILLLVEQSYAANARVIQVADDMLRRLMEV